jgi:polyisoprenyl-teichoic acid--peptidoglycan teichoic acid transferase
MRRENLPPERPVGPGMNQWNERPGKPERGPYVPGELTWRSAQGEHDQRSRPGSGGLSSPPRSHSAPPRYPEQENRNHPDAPPPGAARLRRASNSAGLIRPPAPYMDAGGPPTRGAPPKAPTGPRRQPTQEDIIRRRLRRLKIALIPTILITVLAAVGGGLALRYASVLQLIQSSTGHTVARGNQENGITVPNDILSGQRVNVLLLGSDNDTAKFTGGNGLPGNGVLTQTIIVVSMDPASKTIDLISIPRDSWINFPGSNECLKMDEAAGQGNSPDQAIQFERTVVERDYGIPIWRYAWVGLEGFVKVINTLGGVDVDVLHPIVDDAYPNDVGNPNDQYAYSRLDIPAGPQHLDGETALEYVRSRHSDLTGDYGRSQRQQSVLLALEKKLNTGNVADQINNLAQDLQGNILTDMSVAEIAEVANFGHSVPHGNIKQVVLDPPNYAAGAGNIYRDDGSQTYALLPNWSAVNQTILSTVHPNPTINQNQPCTVNPVSGQWSGDVTG